MSTKRSTTSSRTPIQNVTMSQLSDLTQTPATRHEDSASTEGEDGKESPEGDNTSSP